MVPVATAALARVTLALFAAAQGGAAPPSACPGTDAVWTNVAGLVGAERVGTPATRPTVLLDDLGDRYRVTVAGRAHEYADPKRDCAKRAEVAAVFVGLTLWPLALAAPPPTPPPPPPPPAPVGPEVSVALGPWAGVAVASGQGGPAGAFGLRARVSVMGARFGGVAGVGADWPTRLTLRGVPVDEQRVPADAGVRARVGGERVSVAGELGLLATLLTVGPAGGARTRSLDLGARAGATVEIGFHRRAAFFMGAFAELSPAPRRLAFEPDGPVGRASGLRAGGIAGISLRLR
ncbi:MAG TPA: hypothetical protein VHJ20_03770 [Polyangia bacterium]|nr:hypothetical protein [Polyangia bacterium]